MTDDNPNRSPPATPGDEERRRRARAIAEDVLRRRGRGEALTDIQVLTAHRDLLPELEDALRAVALVEVAQRYAQQKKSSASSGVTLHPDLAGHADAPGAPGVPEASGPAGNLADVKAGAVIPGYQIVRELGQGGQSIVFEAIQVSTGRKVAVKVLRHGALSSTRDTARFDREVQALAALQHPHIVGVLARGVASNGAPYLVTDYIAGQSLHDWIHDRRDQHREGAADEDPAAALRLFLKIADAINAAHLRGIVHRDIKPANIRLDPAGEPHIIDFGLAHLGTHDETDDGQRMTLTGQFLGSLPWASPEQAEGIPDKIDTRTDVYALGVVLYQMLTGQFPYQVAGTMRDMLDIIATATPPPPSAVLAARQAKDARTAGRMRGRPRSAINAALDAIVLKALAKRREDRYQTAGEMSRDVANYLSGKPTVAAGMSPRSRFPLAIFAAIFVPMATLFVGVAYWSHQRHPAPFANTTSATQPVPPPPPPSDPAPQPALSSTPSVTDHQPPTTPTQTAQVDPTPMSRSEVDAWAKRIRDAGGSVEVDAAGEVKVVTLPIECDLDSELPFLLRLRQVRKLGISSASDAAVTHLKGLPELEYLYFLSVPITDAAFADVESWPALKTISLSETKVGDEGIRRIANAPRVYGFTLINQPITDQTFKPLERPGITILVLRGGTVPDGALASLARMPDLGTVELRDSKFTAAGLAHVAKAPNLINLNLARTAVADDALKVFADHPKLKWLGLTECTALTDASIDTFAKMPALEHLRLPIQFQKNTAILHRVFGTRMEGRIDIRHDTTQHGKPAIPFSYRGFAMSVSDPSARVEAVYLSGKPVNDNLIAYLTRFPELRTLSATDAEITDTSMTTLASWGQLRELTLDSCQKLTDAGLDALAKTPQLRSVKLVAQNRITPEAIAKLQTARTTPGIKVVATTRREEAAVEPTTRPADQAPLTPTEIERLVARYAKTNGGWCETDAGGQPRFIHLGPELDLESELPFLRRMPHLNSLSFVNASDEAVRQLADLPALLSLTVEGPFITDAAFDNVESWPTLMSVRLTYTKVTDAGIRRIANAPRFTGIGLVGQPITDQTLKPLERPGIPSIMLQYTTIPDGALASLSRMPDLVNVQLPDCKFTAAGLAHVTKVPNLDSVDLNRTAVTDEQLKLFAGHPKLKGLGLAECTALTEASIDTFATLPALERLTLHEHFQSSAAKLHRLLGTRRRGRIDIHGGSFQEGALVAAFNCQGFVMTVDGLSTRVETIYLNGKPVNDTTLVYLAKFEELRSLTVTGGVITDAGLASLANCGKLQNLTLDTCAKVTPVGVAKLQAARPTLKIFFPTAP